MGLFEIVSEHFDGEVKTIHPKTFWDDRGCLTISYLESDYAEIGICKKFVKEMYTYSRENVLRGLHFQTEPWTGKLIQVITGQVFAAIVDIRETSSTFLKYAAEVLSGDNGRQLWIPSGFALGYYVFKNDTIVNYKFDQYIGADKAIHWNDQDISIPWPLFETAPILSERDASARTAMEYFGEVR